MASCDIHPMVTSPSGEQVKSKLYEDLKTILPKGEVRNFYELVDSEQFKTLAPYGELEKDENGEPTLRALLEHTPLNKRISDANMTERLIHTLGMRSVDNLGVMDFSQALKKVMQLNVDLKEAHDGTQFFRAALVRAYNPSSKKMRLDVKIYRANKFSDFWDYQMEEFAKSFINARQQIMSYATMDDLLYKALSTFPMGINDINTFNPNVIDNLIKQTQENINREKTPVDTVTIAQGKPNYNHSKDMIMGITDEAWTEFILNEELPINITEFKKDPAKFKDTLFRTLFAKYQIDHAIIDTVLSGETAEYCKERLARLNKEVTEAWNNIQPYEIKDTFNPDDTLDVKPEDDPLYIDTEKMIKEMGAKYDVVEKVTINAKELLYKIIYAEQNQVHIQNRLETNADNTEMRNRKKLVDILTAAYEDGCYETALFNYYNHIMTRIKDWKDIVQHPSNNSIENALRLRQAHLELVMFHEISDYVRKYKDEINLDRVDINEDIYEITKNYKGYTKDTEVINFYDEFRKDPDKFKEENPEMVMFAEAWFKVDSMEDNFTIAELDKQVVPLIKDLEDVLNAKTKAFVVHFLEEYQDEAARVIPFGKRKGEENNIEDLLTRAKRDMWGVERLLDSLGDSPDMILRLLDKVAKMAKNNARLNAISISKEIMAEARLLEQAGINDTAWMFKRDEKGNKTGTYIRNGDPEMSEINANPAKLRFYNFFMDAKKYFDDMYPPNTVRLEKIIAINKDLLDRLKDSESIVDMKDEYVESIKDEWMNRNAENEDQILGFTQGGYTLNGEEVNVLPIFYQNVQFGDVKALNSISEDAVSTLIAYAAKAIDYAESNKIINKMELARLVLKQREIPIKKNGMNVASWIANKLQGEQDAADTAIYYKDDGKSNMSQRLGGFMDVVFYAKSRRDDMAIGKFSAIKIVDKLNAWTARAAMSLSVLNGLSNVATGNMMATYEALSKQYFDAKDLAWADYTYGKNTMAMLGNLGKRIKDDKLSLFNEMFDITQEYDKDQLRDVKWNRKTKLGRVEFGEALMFMQNAGEHWMANRTMLSLAHKYKLYDADGNEHNLWDSLEIVYLQEDGMTYGTENKGLGAKLQIKEGYTKEDGTKFTQNDIIQLQLKAASINQGMHGIYNKIDSNMIQMVAIGRLAYIFRKWIWKSYSKRFEGVNYNYNTGEWNEGYYQSAWHFIQTLSSDIKKGKMDIMLHWNELHKTEQQNIKKALWEVGMYLSIMGINAFVDWGEDDGDDNWFKNMVGYQMIRLQSELGSLTIGAPYEWVRLAKSPIPAINTITNCLDTLGALNPFNWTETVERGWAKGMPKGLKLILNNKAINPYYLTFQKTINLKEQMKWYMQ